MVSNVFEIGNCTLVNGCAFDVLTDPDLRLKFDSVYADPPYGVYLGEKKGGSKYSKKQGYNGMRDTPDFVEQIYVPIMQECIELAQCVMLTPGNRNKHMYPTPDDEGVWWNPAGTSTGKWGFQCVVTPIFYYGKDPYAGKGRYPSSPVSVAASREKIDWHPCPKPISFMNWAIKRISHEGQTVLDPFMGSATTAISCIKNNRKFIGIERDTEYFRQACDRITDFVEGDFFYHQEASEITMLLEPTNSKEAGE